MNVQVIALKGQVESQQGVLNATKIYLDFFDLNKLKEYARLAEEQAKMEARLIHQSELDLLKEEDHVKRAKLDKALKEASDSSEQIQLLQIALNEKGGELEQLQIAIRQTKISEQEAQNRFFKLSQELSLAQSIASVTSKQTSKSVSPDYFGITYNRFDHIHKPLVPQELNAFVNPKEVYDLLVTYPFNKLNHGTTIDGVSEVIEERYPQLKSVSISPILRQYVSQMALGTMGMNVWNSHIH